MAGTLDDVMVGRVRRAAPTGPWCSRPSAWECSTWRWASCVYDRGGEAGELHVVDGFFHELRRHGDRSGSRATRGARDHLNSSEFNEEDVYIDLEPMFGRSLYLKCEGFNFAGSIKLKTAAAMVEAAERAGRAAALARSCSNPRRATSALLSA